MVFDSASIAQSITADCGAGHRGAVMLFSIATVVTVSSRPTSSTPTRRTRYWRLRSRNSKAVVHFETYCRRSGFSDSVWAMIKTSAVKTTIGGGGGGRVGGGGGR
jgi:hypothetical protein